MNKQQDYQALVEEAVNQLNQGGAFLMTGEQANPMTIGWCQWGRVWNLPICTVFVRQTRYSYELIQNGKFTVAIPALGTMKEALAYCGTHSGRNENKCEAFGLKLLPGRENGIQTLADCSIHFECETLFTAKADLDNLTDDKIRNQFYSPEREPLNGNPHTLFFGKIVAAYRTDK